MHRIRWTLLFFLCVVFSFVQVHNCRAAPGTGNKPAAESSSGIGNKPAAESSSGIGNKPAAESRSGTGAGGEAAMTLPTALPNSMTADDAELTPEQKKALETLIPKDAETGSAAASVSNADYQGLETNPEMRLSVDSTGAYIYSFPDGQSFAVNVPDGAVSLKPVKLSLATGQSIVGSTKDGEGIVVPQNTLFTEQGTYELNIADSGQGDLTKDNNAGLKSYRKKISFIIRKSKLGNTDFISNPVDFDLSAVTMDGSAVETGTGRSVYLKEDGRYHFSYTAHKNPEIRYEITFDEDRTPPDLTFSKPINGAYISPPVSFSASGDHTVVKVYNNGQLQDVLGNTITQGGIYRVVATDEAGNEKSVNLVIRYTDGILGYRGIIILIVLILGAIIYMVYARRHMQVL